jgi:hypothetical protein
METYEHENDEQEEFSKARYHRQAWRPGGKGILGRRLMVGIVRVIPSEFGPLCSTFGSKLIRPRIKELLNADWTAECFTVSHTILESFVYL